MVSVHQARRLACALPEVVELDHHGRPSFRVGGRIFATLWDSGHMNVMVAAERIPVVVRDHPESCEEVWWGKRLAAVRVALQDSGAAMLGELLEDAWRFKAPPRLLS